MPTIPAGLLFRLKRMNPIACLSGLLLLVLTAGCAPEGPPVLAGAKKAADSPVWPQLLAHCLRAPECDPMAGPGDGAGEASDQSGEASWYAHAANQDGAGAYLSLGLIAARGRGGEAGRVLSIDEQPDSLAGHQARRSSLMLRFEPGSQGGMALAGVSFRSAWLQPADAAIPAYIVELSGRDGVLMSRTGRAEPAPYPAGMEGLSPVIVVFSARPTDQDFAPLIAAAEDGESLTLKIRTPAGAVLLADVIYTLGYEEALRTGQSALSDGEIAAPVAVRCARFLGQPDAFWPKAVLSPALRVCDPRLPQERRRPQAG